MNDDEMLLLLLQTVRVNGNSMMLLNYGYTLLTLSAAIDKLKNEGLIRSINDKLLLTKDGETQFEKKNYELGRKGFYKYVGQMSDMKLEPMPMNQIYVPPKRDKGKKK